MTPMTARYVRVGVVLTISAVALFAWSATASFLYCLVAAHFRMAQAKAMFHLPYIQWLEKLPDIGANWFMTMAMATTGIIGAMPVLLVLLLYRKVGQRSRRPQSLYGNSRLATPIDMRQSGIKADRRPL